MARIVPPVWPSGRLTAGPRRRRFNPTHPSWWEKDTAAPGGLETLALPDLGGFEVGYEDWECYEEESVLLGQDLLPTNETCAGYTGFSGLWVITPSYTGVVAAEHFEDYDAEDPLTNTLNGGLGGFDGAWTIGQGYAGIQASEDFEDYDAEDPLTSTLSEGAGWDGAWTIN